MAVLATRMSKEVSAGTILRRIAERDKTAVEDCIETYGDFVWTLARNLTGSREDAEAVTAEIFADIWRYRGDICETHSSEKKLIAKIALRRLISRQPSVAKDA